MTTENDDKAEARRSLVENPRDFVAMWQEAWDAASEEERTWREKDADEALKAYRGDDASSSTRFNIFHSNMETLIPALYNSTPIPDVRRRFLDEDKVASSVAQVLERSLSFCADDYDFSGTMKALTKDMCVVDRGLSRIRYEAQLDETGQKVTYQTVQAEYVPWRSFRHGPAQVWKDVPWIGFELFLTRSKVEKLIKGHPAEAEMLAETGGIPFSHSANAKGDDKKDNAATLARFGKAARVLEIWDKEERKIYFICPEYADHPLKVEADFLGLRDFYPMPEPAMAIRSTDDLVPIPAYKIYSDLLDQLATVSEKIDDLVDMIKVVGAYAGLSAEIERLTGAKNGDIIALASAELMAQAKNGIADLIMWWPLEPIFKALQVLVEQREVIKQTIYEVTGLSDIVRGATDPNETLGAQQIKQQWGSIRIQNQQKEIERYARDLMGLKAEVMAKHFLPDTFMMITNLKYPTTAQKQQAQEIKAAAEQKIQTMQAEAQAAAQQAQAEGQDPNAVMAEAQSQIQALMQSFQAEAKQIEEILEKPSLDDIMAMMRNDRIRRYRVDIETDSTIRADLTHNQEQMKAFLEGTALFATSVGGLVTEGAMEPEVAVKIYSAFARKFNLGKTAEDALDEWAERISKDGIPQKPPDPEKEANAKLRNAQADKTVVETRLLPHQFRAEQAEKQANFRLNSKKTSEEMQRGRAEVGLARTKQKSEQANAKAEREQVDRHHGDTIKEARNTREQGMKLERMKMSDGRAARQEGYAAKEQKVPLGEVEEEFMTTEERERLERNDQVMAQFAQGMQQMAQAFAHSQQQMQQMAMAQAQSSAATAQAIQELIKVVAAPKRIVRDRKTGKALGSEIAG